MYGGTAKTYATWKQLSAPEKEGASYYITVENPKTGTPKKVRWYIDKAHADLMPNTTTPPFHGKMFGFENPNDYIICVRESNLTEDEISNYFAYSWRWGGKWRYGSFFGGVWYAPKDATIPPVATTKVGKCTWPQFVHSALKYLPEAATSFWVKEAENINNGSN